MTCHFTDCLHQWGRRHHAKEYFKYRQPFPPAEMPWGNSLSFNAAFASQIANAANLGNCPKPKDQAKLPHQFSKFFFCVTLSKQKTCRTSDSAKSEFKSSSTHIPPITSQQPPPPVF